MARNAEGLNALELAEAGKDASIAQLLRWATVDWSGSVAATGPGMVPVEAERYTDLRLSPDPRVAGPCEDDNPWDDGVDIGGVDDYDDAVVKERLEPTASEMEAFRPWVNKLTHGGTNYHPEFMKLGESAAHLGKEAQMVAALKWAGYNETIMRQLSDYDDGSQNSQGEE